MLSDDEREQLTRWARRAKPLQALALRSKIILSSAEGLNNTEVAARLGIAAHTVSDRSQPVLPMMPGVPEKRTHDYFRNGTTSLLAAFNIGDGTVISSIHRRHRAVEFKKFLTKIDTEVPAELDVHIVCDNYATHKTPLVKNWLEAHPRFHIHFTPTGSGWLNQVERWFASLTVQLLQRSVHKNIQALERDIRAWAKDWNEYPRPFIWTKTAEQILESIARLMKRTTGAGH